MGSQMSQSLNLEGAEKELETNWVGTRKVLRINWLGSDLKSSLNSGFHFHHLNILLI